MPARPGPVTGCPAFVAVDAGHSASGTYENSKACSPVPAGRGLCGVAPGVAGSGMTGLCGAGIDGRGARAGGGGEPPLRSGALAHSPSCVTAEILGPQISPRRNSWAGARRIRGRRLCGFSGGWGILAHDENRRAPSHLLKMTHRSEFGRAFGTSKPVGPAPDQIGRQLLKLSATGRFTPERLLTLLSGVPALKKFPVAASQLASAPGLGERILRLVTTRAKRGELVSKEDFMSLLVSQARSGLRRR